jgi:ParB-like chromosome segregation protein Spo0J
LRRQLLENIARKDLEPLEIADAIGDFITRSGRRKPTAQEVATSIGRTSARVFRYRALAGLVTPVRAELAEQVISYEMALELATVKPE